MSSIVITEKNLIEGRIGTCSEFYRCPVCEGPNLKREYSFCPDCGAELEFRFGLGESRWHRYKKNKVSEMRLYVLGEDLSNVSVAQVDDPESDMGMIARNPENHNDQWYMAKVYFEENFEAFKC